MNLTRFLATLSASAISATIAVAERDLPSVDDLTDGIRAFTCDIKEVGVTIPIILVRKEGQWRISGHNYDQIVEVRDGFRIKSSETENMLGFLLQEADGWKLYFQDENGQSSDECQSMDEFTDNIISAIAPKLFDNAASALTASEEELFTSEIERLKQQNEQLAKNSRMWQEVIVDLKQQLQETGEQLEEDLDQLLPNLTARVMYKIGAYSEKYNYELTSVNIEDFNFDWEVNGARMCASILDRNTTPPRDECLQKLGNALLPNSEE